MNLWFEAQERCDWLPPAGEFQTLKDVRFLHRGIHPLPTILAESYFPFYLFRAHRHVDPKAEIAVTPAAIDGEDDELWRSLQSTLKGIATRISQGEQVHYIGSLEYREGIPVRRWDFSSWARLGKPILREFSTPAAQSVRIWIDNAAPEIPHPQRRRWHRSSPWWRPNEVIHEPFERILALAASSIQTLTRTGAAVTLSLTSDESGVPLRCEAGGDPSELLIALATVERVQPSAQSPRQISRWTQALQAGKDETMFIFSCRRRADVTVDVPETASWVTDYDMQICGDISGEAPAKPQTQDGAT
ncbi:DUF58 domain-containing protein [Allorhodopirellula solitaria]|nr:DUF58 domain-containing protein [Allorhodopirellula solitaria]